MRVQVGNAEVNTLADLNAALQALVNLQNAGGLAMPLTTAHFNQTGAPSAAELDQAVANSGDEIYDYMDVGDAVTSVNTALAPIVAPPAGYELVQNAGISAYIADGGIALNAQARNLLVDAANNQGQARHQSANQRGIPAAANGYVHAYGDNALFAFRDDAAHGGIRRVTVLAQGRVNAGEHVCN